MRKRVMLETWGGVCCEPVFSRCLLQLDRHIKWSHLQLICRVHCVEKQVVIANCLKCTIYSADQVQNGVLFKAKALWHLRRHAQAAYRSCSGA